MVVSSILFQECKAIGTHSSQCKTCVRVRNLGFITKHKTFFFKETTGPPSKVDRSHHLHLVQKS